MSKKWRLTERTKTLLTLELANLLLSRIQPGRDRDKVFCGRAQDAINMVANWVPMEATDMAGHLRMMAERGEEPVGFYGGWTLLEKQRTYWNVAYFIPPDVPKDRVALGVVAFDEDYLRKSFLPTMMKDVLTSKSSVLRADANSPVMMIHAPKDSTP